MRNQRESEPFDLQAEKDKRADFNTKEISWVSGTISDSDVCALCKRVFRTRGDDCCQIPVRLPCDHLFGMHCFTIWRRYEVKGCPQCELDIPGIEREMTGEGTALKEEHTGSSKDLSDPLSSRFEVRGKAEDFEANISAKSHARQETPDGPAIDGLVTGWTTGEGTAVKMEATASSKHSSGSLASRLEARCKAGDFGADIFAKSRTCQEAYNVLKIDKCREE